MKQFGLGIELLFKVTTKKKSKKERERLSKQLREFMTAVYELKEQYPDIKEHSI